jgi:tetratricopeptide (TPR) repeat protein
MSLQRYGESYAAWCRAKQLTGDMPVIDRYLRERSDWQNVENLFRISNRDYPNDYHPTFLLAALLENLRRREESVRWFQKAAFQQPTSTVTLSHLASVNVDLGRFAEAGKAITEIRRLDSGLALWLESWTEFSKGNPETALKLAYKLSDSENALWRSRGYSVRACWLSEMGRLREAIYELNTGVAFDVDHGFPTLQATKLLQLAWLYSRQGDLEACRHSCAKAHVLKLKAENACALGIIRARIGDIQAAKTELEFVRAQDASETNYATMRLTGEIALAEGHASQAIASFEKAVDLAPPLFPRTYLANALTEAGDLRGAAELYKEIVRHRGRLYMEPETAVPGSWAESASTLSNIVQHLNRRRSTAVVGQ